MAYHLQCIACGQRHDSSRYRVSCDRCGGLLDARYDTPATAKARLAPGAGGFARYGPTLPIAKAANLVSLGEGNTPVVAMSRLGDAIGMEHLYAKLEFLNPTGSFKDRGNAVQVSVLKEVGVTRAADIAGGNAGHSFAAYCARAGITFVGFAYEGAHNRKVEAIALTGAEMHWVEGSRQECRQAMERLCEDTGTLFMDYQRNPYFAEGLKTMAYEIGDQMDPLPDHVVVPVGNGSILLGLWRGFREMVEDGRLQRIPKLHAVQSQAFQPLVAALAGRRPATPAPRGATVAVGIQISAPPRLDELVKVCRESGGVAVAVSDRDTLSWYRRLSELEGMFVEPTSATVLAGIQRLVEEGTIGRAERVLAPLTGSGFKEPVP